MLCTHLKTSDPYFCLAAEEYLLKNFDEDIFMLWQSEKTVVVGKHQNALAEINYPFVYKNNINVARRISGGGTVFHDNGNVNFTFIKSVKSPAEISFKIFTQPVVTALAKLGIKATSSGRNDLLIDGLKISGNAEHVYKNKVLHHGTLLFDTDLENLGQAIKVAPGKYESRAVQSNRSKVTNISNYLRKKISVEDFIQFLLDVQLEDNANSKIDLSENDVEIIQKLVHEKFETWKWNFGYSPKYSFKNRIEIDGNIFSVKMDVVKGIISEIEIGGDYFLDETNAHLSERLRNKRHIFDDIRQEIRGLVQVAPDDLFYDFF
ncbi:MAG: lipoate--protein ligase [Prolixibacteraceae bacterium]|nr:lipoate--protein ligase [Prolixibacteraceae bacterium]